MTRTTSLMLLCCLIVVAGCGDEERPRFGGAVHVPEGATVTREQIEAAREHGVPVVLDIEEGFRFVLVPAGSYKAGPPRIRSRSGKSYQRDARVDAPFYMQTTEVTNAQYRRFQPDHVCAELEGYALEGEDNPVCGVTWHEAVAFATHMGARLPTEAEWERAARGGLAEKTYPWGNAWDPKRANAVNDEDGYLHASPVGSFAPNAYGLYDMAGNVQEWCADPWVPSRYELPKADPMFEDMGPWPVNGGDMSEEELAAWRAEQAKLDAEEAKLPHRAVRGGSWMVPNVDCARRFGLAEKRRNIGIGFRLVVPLSKARAAN